MEQKIETKKGAILPLILVLIVLVILVGVWYWWTKRGVTLAPTEKVTPEKVTPKEDSVTVINQELDKIEILDLDREFKEIDQDLNSL